MNHRVIFVPDDYWTNPPKENHMFDDHPSRDVIPPAPPSRETILGWDAAVGTQLSTVVPGEIECDDDGMPSTVGPSTTYRDTVGSLAVYRDQLDAAGLTAADVPNLTVYERREDRR